MTDPERAAYEAGFRECQRRAGDECSAVAGMAGMAARAGCEGLTWREVQGVLDEQATLIRALAPEPPAPAPGEGEHG